MAKRKFRLQQAKPGAGLKRGVDFRSYMEADSADGALSDPVISSVCGDELDYGKLFAYCFRRFGYPDRGWDDYKELVGYVLTTPHPDMVLRVTPYVGDTSVLSLRFMVGFDTGRAIEAYAQRDRRVWEQRMFDWAEKEGLPDWMPEWIEVYNTEYREAFPDVPVAVSWRQVVHFSFALGEAGSRPYELTSRVAAYRKKLHEDYCLVEAWPAYYMRPASVHEWNEDDPLKPLALAAMVALEDLRTPVGVRDQSINAFGLVPSGRADVKASPSAGYPSGALGNTAATEFSDLHSLILKMGKGNAKRGIEKLMAVVGACA